MDDVTILEIQEKELSEKQKISIDELLRHCFSDVDPKEIMECFYAESFERILAFKGDDLIGHLRLFRRKIPFDGREIVLGGIGGVCVAEHFRGKRIATRMIKRGLKILEGKECDVACLNADLSKTAHRLYERIGFTLMNRKISFEDIHGNLRYDEGTMFIPVCSMDVYDRIMSNDETFHYGKGYW